MCVHITFSLVWVAERPFFGKELLTRLTICSPCILSIDKTNFKEKYFKTSINHGKIWQLTFFILSSFLKYATSQLKIQYLYMYLKWCKAIMPAAVIFSQPDVQELQHVTTDL